MFSRKFQRPKASLGCFKVYKILLRHFGPQGWWPACNALRSNAGKPALVASFEVMVGAILTQSTNWKNVGKAIANLKQEKLLAPLALFSVSNSKLEKAIRPSGYYKQKAKKLKSFINYLFRAYRGNLIRMFKKPLKKLRAELLGVWGIGRETADSILLYAAHKPVFVVDAYTKRIFKRLGLITQDNYEEIRSYFESKLPRSVPVYKEFHALIVELGKKACKKLPVCDGCPLIQICPKKV